MKKRQPLQMPSNSGGGGEQNIQQQQQQQQLQSYPMQIPVNSEPRMANAGRHFISASMPTSMFATTAGGGSFAAAFGHQQQLLQQQQQRMHRPIMPLAPHQPTLPPSTINPSVLAQQQQQLQMQRGINASAADDLLLHDALFPLSIEGMEVESTMDPSPLDAQMMADDYLDFNNNSSSNEDFVSTSVPDSVYSVSQSQQRQSGNIPHSPAASFGNSNNNGGGGGINSAGFNAQHIRGSSNQSSHSAISQSPSATDLNLSSSLGASGATGKNSSNESLLLLKSGSGSGSGNVEELEKHAQHLEKQRRRRESHNAVERRRRDNINDRIQELSVIVPDCGSVGESAAKQSLNKGIILKKSTDYIRYLQKTSQSLMLHVKRLESELASLKASNSSSAPNS